MEWQEQVLGVTEDGAPREHFTFLRVKVSCLLPTAVSAMLLVPECSSYFRRSSKEALEEHTHITQTQYTNSIQRAVRKQCCCSGSELFIITTILIHILI